MFCYVCLDVHKLKRSNLTEQIHSVFIAVGFFLMSVTVRQSSEGNKRLKHESCGSCAVRWCSVHSEDRGGGRRNISSFCDRNERWGVLLLFYRLFSFVCFELRPLT